MTQDHREPHWNVRKRTTQEHRTFQMFIQDTLGRGRLTVHAATLADVQDAYGWAVGGAAGHPEYTAQDLDAVPSHVSDLIADIDVRYIGTWVDDSGAIVVDAIDIITDTDRAIDTARERDQRAIYHLGRHIMLWLVEPAGDGA